MPRAAAAKSKKAAEPAKKAKVAKAPAKETKKAAPKRGTKRAAEEQPEKEVEEKPVQQQEEQRDEPKEAAAPAAKRRKVEPAAKKEPAVKKQKAAPPLFPGVPALDLFTFGTNSFGALGLGDPAEADDPDTLGQVPRPKLPVSDTLKFVQVAAGGMHTVGLTPDGDIYTWGVNDEGALGRKTAGTCWEKEPDSAKGDPFVPGLAPLPGGMKAVQVAAGDGFTFAIGTDGFLYGCGHFKDEVGALSGFTPDVKMQGLFIQVWKPESVRDRIKKLACGARHAVLLTNRGAVLTWGSGSQGQLGRVKPYHQDSPDQPTAAVLFAPTEVVHLPGALGNSAAVDVTCGAYSTFVIAKNGDVAAWGLNNSGQLGIPKANDDDNLKWDPVSVDSLSGIAHIAGGEQHSLALTKKGVLLSFGAATYGMLGRRALNTNSANEKYPEPTPVDGLEGLVVETIAAATNVSACTTRDGDAYFWGSNTNLQLCKGTDEEDEVVPKKMGRVKVFGYRKVHAVVFGGQHGALLAAQAGEAAAGGAAAAPAPAPAAPAPAVGGSGSGAEAGTSAAAAPAPAPAAAPAAALAAAPAAAPAEPKAPEAAAAPAPEAAPAAEAAAAPDAMDADGPGAADAGEAAEAAQGAEGGAAPAGEAAPAADAMQE